MSALREDSGPTTRKPGRGKGAATIALGRIAHDILAASRWAMTLRQLHYAIESHYTALGTPEAYPKTDASYRRLARTMRDLREDGTVPWGWLVDHTRSVVAARTFDGIADLLADSARLYRRDLMRSQFVAIQLWAESDSIGSVIAQVADRYTVPTFIGRGYSARGYLWNAARDAVAAHGAGKTVEILHVGDYDPSGEDIYRDVEQTLRLYAWAAERRFAVTSLRRYLRSTEEIWAEAGVGDLFDVASELRDATPWLRFERLALTPEQIEEHALPSRPPKASDVRARRFTGSGAVEVEALPVDVLLGIVEDAILARIDPTALAAAELAEASEREVAARIAAVPLERLVEAAS